MSTEIYLAKEGNAIYFNNETKWLIHAENVEQPSKLPDTGMFEVCRLYGFKIDTDTPFPHLEKVMNSSLLAINYCDLDVESEDHHRHIIFQKTSDEIDQELIDSIDLINVEGMTMLGDNYTYDLDFQEMSYKE